MISSRQTLCIFLILTAFFLLGNPLPSALAGTGTRFPNQSDAASFDLGSFKGIPAELEIEPLARLGDWIYYLQPCSPYRWQQAELYRVKTNGNDAEKILPRPLGPSNNIRFVNGWIYYGRTGANGGLHRIRPDGSNDMQLAGRVNGYEVRGPYVFYEYVDGLYRIDSDGQNRTLLDGGVSDYYVSRIEMIAGDWIYYQRVTSEHNDPEDRDITNFSYGLYRVRLDGSQRTPIIEETLRGGRHGKGYPSPIRLVISGDEIYYAGPHSSDGAIFAVKTDGSERHLVCTNPEIANPSITEIYTNNHWIYYKYSYATEQNGVGKVKTDGKEKQRLKVNTKLQLYPEEYQIARALCSNTNIDGEWVYYSTRHEICRIRTDSTQKSVIYNAGNYDIYWINLRGDYLFFNWVAKTTTYSESVYRCKVKTDGSSFAEVEAP